MICTMFCCILCCFIAKFLFYTIYAVLSRNLFCRDLRALAWRKIGPTILSVEKKGQISGMGEAGKEQAEAVELGDGWATGRRGERCEVRRVLSPHTEGTQECLRRGHPPIVGTSWRDNTIKTVSSTLICKAIIAAPEKEMSASVICKKGPR